ncbi:SCP2 domain-containing protein [Alkalilimnicola ehrlichii]|nr:SCP2 sterol-binding domain-containing protein [Alkalilimnicola ehrlichii]
MDPLNTAFQQLVTLANKLLLLDPEAKQRLRPLAGRVLAVELEGVELPLHVLFTEEAITIADPEMPVDATVRAELAALLSLAARRGRGNTGAVEFRGDVAVVHGVRSLLSELEIDWEEQLSRFTGDIVAHQVGNFFRGFQGWLSRGRTTFEQNLSEYLTEEIGQVPPEAELSGFLDDVDQLRQDTDRLAARIALLEKRRKGRGT